MSQFLFWGVLETIFIKICLDWENKEEEAQMYPPIYPMYIPTVFEIFFAVIPFFTPTIDGQ